MNHFHELITHKQYIIAQLPTDHIKEMSFLKTRCDDVCGVLNSESISRGRVMFMKTSCCISWCVYVKASVFWNLRCMLSFLLWFWKINRVGWRQQQGPTSPCRDWFLKTTFLYTCHYRNLLCLFIKEQYVSFIITHDDWAPKKIPQILI